MKEPQPYKLASDDPDMHKVEARTSKEWASHLRNEAYSAEQQAHAYPENVKYATVAMAMRIGADAILGEGQFFCLNCCTKDRTDQLADILDAIFEADSQRDTATGGRATFIEVMNDAAETVKAYREEESC